MSHFLKKLLIIYHIIGILFYLEIFDMHYYNKIILIITSIDITTATVY